MFNKPGIFYSMDPKIVFTDDWFLDPIKIEGLKQHNLCVLDFSSEHYGVDGIEHVYHALDEAGLNFVLLCHDPADHKKFNRLFFYPHWYHHSIACFVFNNNQSDYRTYKWSCLNANPRPHRIYNYFYSKQQSYYDSAFFTFHQSCKDEFRSDDVILSQEVLEFWNNIKHTLPSRDKLKLDMRGELPANTDSYVHLITETTVIPKIFVTEKTWKPIAAGQLFLLQGNPGTIEYLRAQGVDVFDDIIDHGYDLVEDWKSRTHQIHQQLDRLLQQDLNQIYVDTHQRRQANVEKFFSGAFDQQYQLSIQQCINMLS